MKLWLKDVFAAFGLILFVMAAFWAAGQAGQLAIAFGGH